MQDVGLTGYDSGVRAAAKIAGDLFHYRMILGADVAGLR
jgi:hypothetical protein